MRPSTQDDDPLYMSNEIYNIWSTSPLSEVSWLLSFVIIFVYCWFYWDLTNEYLMCVT